ncbi:uncharacterized protein BX664DRAFT_332805 [Halteromyces radiatus]|uniref:uncharacterized protein n=1 Tax=Halteromyces radiatus TaxID=101107 RepID=UPI00221F5F24|nr:uncharacterized protein BX664DRAFT_332805 [Halteromyces radiatus]KAI8089355.1 hypothetical protein BX664DRAFT_332805 [Halteromyces radiatus]
MEFKKILSKVHDKVTHTSSPHTRRRSIGDKRFNTLNRWRDKWNDRPRFFTNKHTSSSSPPIISKRPHSIQNHQPIIDHYEPQIRRRPVTFIQQQQQHQQHRLSVPHVVDHLRATCYTPTTCTFSSTEYDDEDDDHFDAGSFYNIPPPNLPLHPVAWYNNPLGKNLSSQHSTFIPCSQTTKSSSSISSSSSSIIGLLSIKEDTYSSDETLQHPGSLMNDDDHDDAENEDHDDDEDDYHNNAEDDDHDDHDDSAALSSLSDYQDQTHYHLAVMNVDNVMKTMREHQLELQMAQIKMENQRLQQQMDDMASGTWTSTNQLLQENDRLERHIQHLQRQQHWLHSKRESYRFDEQEALRHTRAQLGLVEFLEGEPDVKAALTRFKKLLASSC